MRLRLEIEIGSHFKCTGLYVQHVSNPWILAKLINIADKKKYIRLFVQGGEDSQDPLSCRSFSTKEPLNIGHFCGK